MADAESSMLYSVESYDYAAEMVIFTWKGDDADEAVAQFITAMDSAADERILPFHREATILAILAEFLAGGSFSTRIVGHHRITLTRTTK